MSSRASVGSKTCSCSHAALPICDDGIRASGRCSTRSSQRMPVHLRARAQAQMLSRSLSGESSTKSTQNSLTRSLQVCVGLYYSRPLLYPFSLVP
eukprot:6203177-Pleurochrysis_carterae.AAC.6